MHVRVKTVQFPIRAQVIMTHGKPGVIIPKAIADFLNIGPDWSAFEVSLIEGGLFLKLIDKRSADI